MIALELNPSTRSGKSQYVDVIKVASAYTRNNIQNMINTSNIRFVSENENRVNKWLKVNRLQLPLPSSTYNSVNNSISQNSEKSTDSAKKDENNLRHSLDADKYSYDTLTKKDDIQIITIPSEIPMTDDGKVDKKAIIARGKLNARNQKNPNNTEAETYVRIHDIDLDVLLGTNGMQHGLARSNETALVIMGIGDILQNSIAVNELNGSAARKTEMSYVLIGACQNSEGFFIVRSIVSKLLNEVTEIDVYQLSAVKGKNIETPNSALKRGAAVTEQSSLISSESPTISISDLLKKIKDFSLINEIFSKDVAEKLQVERSKGSLSGDLRYSKSKSDNYKNYSSKFNENIKRRAVNESMLKRYTLTDSDKIITEIMGELGFYDGYSEYGVSLKGKSKTEAIRALTDGLNSKKEGESNRFYERY